METDFSINKSRSQIIKMINRQLTIEEEEEKGGKIKSHQRSDYRTIKDLGKGSYGRVYLVENDK